MSKPTTVRGVLLAAARLIERKGWCRGQREDSRGRHCVIGAISEVVTGHAHSSPYLDPLFNGAYGALAAALPSFPMDWNDNEAPSKASVLAALRRAARAAK